MTLHLGTFLHALQQPALAKTWAKKSSLNFVLDLYHFLENLEIIGLGEEFARPAILVYHTRPFHTVIRPNSWAFIGHRHIFCGYRHNTKSTHA